MGKSFNESNSQFCALNFVFRFQFFRILVNIIIWIYQVGACGIYVVFIATNIKSVVDYFTDTELSIRIFMLILLLPLVFINWVKKIIHLRIKFISMFLTDLGPKLEILGTIFFYCQYCDLVIICHNLLLHIPWANRIWRQTISRSNLRNSIFYWYDKYFSIIDSFD